MRRIISTFGMIIIHSLVLIDRWAICCYIRNMSHTVKESTTRRSTLAHLSFDKAPNAGAYPPVKRGCSQLRLLCNRCHRCFLLADAFCCPLMVSVVIAVEAESCCERCSYTGLPGFLCPMMMMAKLFHSLVADRMLGSTIDPCEKTHIPC